MAKYACTSCFNLFPSLESLSEAGQLCVDCQNSSVANKKEKFICEYCQSTSSTADSTSKICDKCIKNQIKYGEPQNCVFCGLKAAFIGSKCRRCSTSYKMFGNPKECCNCKAKAAFGDKNDNTTLCWKCSTNFKQNRKRKINSSNQPSDYETYSQEQCNGTLSNSDSWPDLMRQDRDYRLPPSSSNYQQNKDKSDSSQSSQSPGVNNGYQQSKKSRPEKNGKPKSNKSNNHVRKDNTNAGTSSLFEDRINSFQRKLLKNFPGDIIEKKKSSSSREPPSRPTEDIEKPMLPKPAPMTSLPSLSEINTNSPSLFEKMKMDHNSPSTLSAINDTNIVLVTNLREEINSLKKQLAKKDASLLEKDKQISCIKVDHLREQRDIRAKLKEKDEQHIKTVEQLQTKNGELLRKISQLSKGKV